MFVGSHISGEDCLSLKWYGKEEWDTLWKWEMGHIVEKRNGVKATIDHSDERKDARLTQTDGPRLHRSPHSL